ncbi:MAG: hypothetical protein IJ666_03505 [Ruminococcus sp.]|nr:hypothetical protein [Ruminococcus sp.]
MKALRAYQADIAENSPMTGDAGAAVALIAALSAVFVAIGALKTGKK